MHSTHIGSHAFQYKALKEKPKQQTLKGCAGMRNKRI
jgi:hypothetical protein